MALGLLALAGLVLVNVTAKPAEVAYANDDYQVVFPPNTEGIAHQEQHDQRGDGRNERGHQSRRAVEASVVRAGHVCREPVEGGGIDTRAERAQQQNHAEREGRRAHKTARSLANHADDGIHTISS